MIEAWKFRKMKRAEQNRDPIEAEFFRRDDYVESLVRESIQNSLDASVGAGPVRVRIALHRGNDAATRESAAPLLNGLRRHLDAAGVGKPETLDECVPYLTIEDFGTRGLEGNVAASRPSELGDGREDFFFFWRNVGRTGKTGSERGSWGLGKAVYTMSSDIRAMFGWTIRESENPSVAMGQAVLKVHEVEAESQKEQYDAYGFFGTIEDDGFALPVSSQPSIDTLRSVFQLSRTVESGFSVVVPFPVDEFSQTDVGHKIACAVIQHYAFPILMDALEVEVTDGSWTCRIKGDDVIDKLEDLNWPTPEIQKRTERLLQLAMFAKNKPEPAIRLQRAPGKSARWADMTIPDGVLSDAKSAFLNGSFQSFRIPILIRPRGEADFESHLDVFMHKDTDASSGTFHFIRQGLTLTDMEVRMGNGVVGIVRVDDEGLARLLRDSENPAHTQWKPGAARLKENYLGGQVRVRFCASTPKALVAKLLEVEEDKDFDMLSEMFPDTTKGDGSRSKVQQGKGPKPGTNPPPKPPPATPQAIRMRQTKNGFVLSRNSKAPLEGNRLTIRMAYDCISGNPMKRWKEFDFKAEELTIDLKVATIVSSAGNCIVVDILGDGFELTVSGFSVSRDLVVQLQGPE